MAAPGGLLFAKIIKPETDTPDDNIADEMDGGDEQTINVIDAAAGGASVGLQLALNVGAMLSIHRSNYSNQRVLVASVVGCSMEHLTLELLLGWIFNTLSIHHWCSMGRSNYRWFFHWSRRQLLTNSLHTQTSYHTSRLRTLKSLKRLGQVMSVKTQTISFALCGFANLSSIAILLGGLGGIAPSRHTTSLVWVLNGYCWYSI